MRWPSLLGFLPVSAEAAQIVVENLAAVGTVPAALAASLDGILLTELSRIDGMSIIAEADVRAMLALEANKQRLGCDDTGCLTEIAGSLGAELLVTATLSRIGDAWVCALTLIRVDNATVARRATGQAAGKESVAPDAVTMAVHELFRTGLPTELQGPAAMTQRGFKALLAGFYQATLDPTQDPRPTRKRIILDLVQTELDYDAEPKMEILDLDIRRSMARIETASLLAKDGADLERHLRALDQYGALAQDLGRVKEIRQRSRERGLVPSARALRFEDPDPRPRIDPAQLERYRAAAKVPIEIASKALAAYQKNDPTGFARNWKKGYEANAGNELESGRRSDQSWGYTYDLLPLHAVSPPMLEQALSVVDDGRMIVFLRRYKKGQVDDESRVYFEKEDGQWRISGW